MTRLSTSRMTALLVSMAGVVSIVWLTLPLDLGNPLALPSPVATPLLMYARAESRLERGDPAAALAECQSLMVLRPDYPGLWRLQGLAYRDMGNSPLAIKALREAVNRDPDDAVAWLALAELLLERDKVIGEARSEVAVALLRASELDNRPDGPARQLLASRLRSERHLVELRCRLADLHVRDGRIDWAILEYEMLRRDYPDNPQVVSGYRQLKTLIESRIKADRKPPSLPTRDAPTQADKLLPPADWPKRPRPTWPERKVPGPSSTDRKITFP